MMCSHCLGLVFYRQLWEQLSVALLSRPTVTVFYNVIHCYYYTFGQINDDDDDDDDDDGIPAAGSDVSLSAGIIPSGSGSSVIRFRMLADGVVVLSEK